jgi:hypothetical protein
MTDDRPVRPADERGALAAGHAHAGRDDVGHERSDVRAGPIFVAAAGLAVVIGIALVITQILFGYYAVREARHSPSANPLAGAYGRQAPPAPRLQSDPLADLATLRASEDAALRGYGWLDREAGVARIPIERAMDLVAERGLSARPGRQGASGAAADTGGTAASAESGDSASPPAGAGGSR